MRTLILLLLTLSCLSCQDPHDQLPIFPSQFITNGFDYPVGIPDGNGYYNAQGFGVNKHLGDDWNGIRGGNTDLGDPVHVIAHGYVHAASDLKGGWGRVVRVWHQLPDSQLVESVYAHLDTMMVKAGTWVSKGSQIGTIGTAHGRYPAHLHLEIRDSIFMPIGGGYDSETSGYLDPDKFIREHRSIK